MHSHNSGIKFPKKFSDFGEKSKKNTIKTVKKIFFIFLFHLQPFQAISEQIIMILEKNKKKSDFEVSAFFPLF